MRYNLKEVFSMHYTRTEFETFLKNVDLDGYRALYAPIKTVEMDLIDNTNKIDITPLNEIYKLYWEEEKSPRTIATFDEFYDYYYKSKEQEILKFWSKSGFGMKCDCFPRGLKARIYRTWCSLITQIHAAYVAEEVFGKECVYQSTKLDKNKIDILVEYKGRSLKVQIKKETWRREIRRMSDPKEKAKDLIYLKYYVPSSSKEYAKPRGRNKRLKGWARQFVAFSPRGGFLDRFNNGFIVFTKKKFEAYKEKIDSGLI